MSDAPLYFSPPRTVTREECHAQMSMAPSTFVFAFGWLDAETYAAEREDPADVSLSDAAMPVVGFLTRDPILGFDHARARAIDEAIPSFEGDPDSEEDARAMAALLNGSQWRFEVENEHDVRIVRYTAVLEHPTQGAVLAVSCRVIPMLEFASL